MTVNGLLKAKNELDRKVSWALQDFENSTGVRVRQLDIGAHYDEPDGKLITYFVQSNLVQETIKLEKYDRGFEEGYLDEFKRKLEE